MVRDWEGEDWVVSDQGVRGGVCTDLYGGASAAARPGEGPRGARPPATVPRRSPRGGGRGCPHSLLLQKWKGSQRRWQERISLRAKKCKARGRGEQGANRLKWPTKKRRSLTHEDGESKDGESPASAEQERKRPSLTSAMYRVLPVVPVSLRVQSRGIFLSAIL